ncbi:hypothetical protein [Shewanella marisflavi]|uniref:hypothetical protein n=1 Tax=Shewanella marisflavi TaxID=260364 RepID=UPI003AACDED5
MIEEQYLGKTLQSIPSQVFHSGFDDPSCGVQRYPALVIASTEVVPPSAMNWFLAEQDCGAFGSFVKFKSAAIFPLAIRPCIHDILTNIVDEEFAGESGLDYFSCESPDEQKRIQDSYLAVLANAGLSCSNVIVNELTQALYPVDATRENLSILSDDSFDFDAVNGINGLTIYIVGRNSD